MDPSLPVQREKFKLPSWQNHNKTREIILNLKIKKIVNSFNFLSFKVNQRNDKIKNEIQI